MLARLTWVLLSRHRYPGWRPRLATIRRLGSLSREAFRTWQAEAIRRYLQWAGATIPHFRDVLRPGAHLEDLPVLSRADVQTHVEALRDPTRPREALRRESSGGSTGEPVVVYQDQAYHSWDHATEAHVFETWGLDPWCRSAFLWGADRDIVDLPRRERLWIWLLGQEVVNAFRMGETELAAAADRLERFQPVYLQGYASALELMAAWLLEHRPDHGIRPRAIRSSAETLTSPARALIERAFASRVYDFYGSRESASIAAECPAGGMHVQAHARVVEIVDEQGRPVGPSTPGRLLVTDLTNRAFGLLRYETGDVASWATDGDCPCGSPYPRLERIFGRTSDFITTPDGERIHGEWFTHLFYGRQDVKRFQVYQPDRHRLEVRTVGSASEADLADLLQTIRTRMGPGVEVTWERLDSIPSTVSGKRRFTVSDVPFLPKAP